MEATFTPKMRKRSFSVKRFKRKKSEGKLKPMLKETLIIHASEPGHGQSEDQVPCSQRENGPRVTRASVNGTPQHARKITVTDGDSLIGDMV